MKRDFKYSGEVDPTSSALDLIMSAYSRQEFDGGKIKDLFSKDFVEKANEAYENHPITPQEKAFSLMQDLMVTIYFMKDNERLDFAATLMYRTEHGDLDNRDVWGSVARHCAELKE
jgi:hypothetical protein